MSKISLSKLESFLKAQCDDLRAAGLDASEYKDYIISMLFLKRVNDLFEDARSLREVNLRTEYPEITEDDLNAELEMEDTKEYEFFVPVDARWNALHTLQENVGDGITIALNALENSNKDILEGVLSSTKFNTLKSNGEKLLSDDVLISMLQGFNEMKLRDENFEFPDLLGAAYEFLIKYFAESAGKKGGEFYTPGEVVQLMALILQPGEKDELFDPTIGSGGLVINLRNYVEARYGSARNLTIHGQELKEGIYKMCKMNMIFHGIRNARIEMGDTLLTPKLVQNGVLLNYNIVVANPPFSQNYTTDKMEHKERFKNWMSTKKQADFMFVQHMIAVLKNDGRMAVIMPHGVLFRGGEEQKMRKRLIDGGFIEAIIGLPQGLFYGTGIPASMLIINKANAAAREEVLFINADKEFKEGKNQNRLRPEDIDKISYVYHNRIKLDKYSILVTKAELAAEDYNCNIRRYVDNSPPATPQDVHAHLKGGIPLSEIDSLDSSFLCYDSLKQSLFVPLKPGYNQFAPQIENKEAIKELIAQSKGRKLAIEKYTHKINEFWDTILPKIGALPADKNVFDYTKYCTEKFSEVMDSIAHPLLSEFQTRGSFAQYTEDLKYDFKSVAASGWNAELIPDEEILQSQYPAVLADLLNSEARRDELEATFKEVNELEEGEWSEENYEVIPKSRLTEIRAQIKKLTAQVKQYEKESLVLDKRIKAWEKESGAKGATQAQISDADYTIQSLSAEQAQVNEDALPYGNQLALLQAGIERHLELENELKACRIKIKQITAHKDQLVDKAREKISSPEAKDLIIRRWHATLHSVISGYLEAHTRQLQLSMEDLHEKYTDTLEAILAVRETETVLLNNFLTELGYE